MKNALIMTCIAVLAISSCVKDEVKEVNRGHAIDFRAATQTKGEMVNGTWSLANFYATALNEDATPYFRDVPFTYVGDYFSSSPEYYWPGDDRTLDFYAYSPSLEKLGGNAQLTLNQDTKKISGITPHSDILKQVDFLSAVALDKTEENSANGIDIEFFHNMPALLITVDNELDSYEYIVKGVKINNAISSGDIDLDNREWTLESGRVDYELSYDSPKVLAKFDDEGNNVSKEYLFGTYEERDGYEQNHYAFILPQQFHDLDSDTPEVTMSLNLQINFINTDGSKTKVFPTSGDYEWVTASFPTYYYDGELCGSWKVGTRYEYNVKFNSPATQLGEPIKMTMSFKPWVDGNSNTFANADMIGIWNATAYYELIVRSYSDNEDPEAKLEPQETYIGVETVVVGEGDDAVTYKIVKSKKEESTDSQYISGQVGDFHYVEITDGTKLYIKVNGVTGETPYIVENNYLLIDAFKNSYGEYEVRPHIDDIIPVGADGSEGLSHISVLQSESGSYETNNYYSRTQMITYTINAFN